MSYHDLPPNVRDLPLTDPALAADVVDLMLGEDERRAGCLGMMLCDETGRGVQPVVVSDVPERARVDALSQLLELVLPVLGEQHGALLVGRGRRRGLTPTDDDRVWHQCVIDACQNHGVRLLGYHLATPDGVLALPEPLSNAS